MYINKKDRLILHNQYLILEKLYPENAREYAICREAVESGYELQYDWMTEFLVDPMSRESCLEVLDIMSMHSTLLRVAQDNNADSELLRRVKFDGFDGNNETEYMSYAQFLILELGRFSDLKQAGPKFPTFNSHMPTLDRYRRMLEAWKATDGNKWDPTIDDVRRIASAGTSAGRGG